MTYKQIETSREIRLWVTQIATPLITAVLLVPEVREEAVKKVKEVSTKIKAKFHK